MRAAPLVLIIAFAACLALQSSRCDAADAAAEAAPATPPAATAPAGATLVSEEDKWVFTPPAGRPDIFYDYENFLVLEKRHSEEIQETRPVDASGGGEHEDPAETARAAIQRIEVFMSQRKWDEAIKVCDQVTKKLANLPGNADVAKYLQVIKGYQDQAQDALLRDEAQAAFDALNLKVEGILWSENGPRLAILSGEPRALGINDRVKDCVIINIDTDRVDFRYHYKRKRFEFPRYVGDDLKK